MKRTGFWELQTIALASTILFGLCAVWQYRLINKLFNSPLIFHIFLQLVRYSPTCLNRVKMLHIIELDPQLKRCKLVWIYILIYSWLFLSTFEKWAAKRSHSSLNLFIFLIVQWPKQPLLKLNVNFSECTAQIKININLLRWSHYWITTTKIRREFNGSKCKDFPSPLIMCFEMTAQAIANSNYS